MSFRPDPTATYRVRVDERKQVYESTLRFESVDGAWRATEASFSLVGPHVGELGDLASSELDWRVDLDGTPTTPPVQRGTGKYLEQMSLFQFRPVALPAKTSACPGTEWTRTWKRGERTFSYKFRVGELRDGVATIHMDGSATSAINEWETKGQIEIQLRDGFAGKATLHVRGPDAPRMNEFDRVVVISR